MTPERITKPSAAHVLMNVRADGRAISFFGDLHPSFAGNVVKAMASAKQGYPVVSRMLERRKGLGILPATLIARLNAELRPVVHAVNRLTPTIVEVVVRAPMAARAFEPGQFYRLQNYETFSRDADGTRLTKEGLALTGAAVDRERGLLSTIVLEMGGSSDLCAQLAPGEPVILMGPTGHPTETPGDESVLLIGGGLGNAVLFSIGQALRRNGSRVLYFAGYKRAIDRYKVDEIERAADAIVWCCDEPPGFRAEREQDKAFVGNIVAALDAYGSGALGEAATPQAASKAWCSPASTRTRTSTAWISTICARGSTKTACRKSSRGCGSTARCAIWACGRPRRSDEQAIGEIRARGLACCDRTMGTRHAARTRRYADPRPLCRRSPLG